MLWLLCGIGAVVFSTSGPSIRQVAATACAFAATSWLLRGGAVPDAASVAGLAAIVAGLRVYRPAWVTLASLCGGMLAGVLAALLESQGIAPLAALLCGAALPAASIALSARKPGFAPGTILEEGTLVVLVLGLAAAVGPAILDGWQSARVLNSASGAANQALPGWVLSMAVVSLFLGGAWSLWRHR
jgi:hypothetical protein